jgi:hypothetical protein
LSEAMRCLCDPFGRGQAHVGLQCPHLLQARQSSSKGENEINRPRHPRQSDEQPLPDRRGSA